MFYPFGTTDCCAKTLDLTDLKQTNGPFVLKLDRRPTDRQVICRDGNDGMDYPLYFLTSDVMLHLHHLRARWPMAGGDAVAPVLPITKVKCFPSTYSKTKT